MRLKKILTMMVLFALMGMVNSGYAVIFDIQKWYEFIIKNNSKNCIVSVDINACPCFYDINACRLFSKAYDIENVITLYPGEQTHVVSYCLWQLFQPTPPPNFPWPIEYRGAEILKIYDRRDNRIYPYAVNFKSQGSEYYSKQEITFAWGEYGDMGYYGHFWYMAKDTPYILEMIGLNDNPFRVTLDGGGSCDISHITFQIYDM